MADDLAFGKQKLSQLTSSKKTTTVEAAFDSDESNWSDDDGENTSVVKQSISGKDDKNTKNVPNLGPPRRNSFFMSQDTNEHIPHVNDGSRRRDSVVSFSSPSKRRKSVQQSDQEPQPFSSSPY